MDQELLIRNSRLSIINDDLTYFKYLLNTYNLDEYVSMTELTDLSIENSSGDILDFIVSNILDFDNIKDEKIVEWFYNCFDLNCLKIIIDKDLQCNNILCEYFKSNNYSYELLDVLDNEMKDYVLSVYYEFN